MGRLWIAAMALVAGALPIAGQEKVDSVADLRFAVAEIGRECRDLLRLKGIDWPKVTAPLLRDARRVKTGEEHLVLLWRLLARLQDGHAAVQPLEKGKDVKPEWPDRSAGPGLFLCRVGDRIYLKNAWGPAAGVGLEPGMEVLKIDGTPALKWLDVRTESIRDLASFSTAHQAFFHTCHQGLADAPNTRVAFEVRDADRKTKKRTVTWAKANQTPYGPAFPPEQLEHTADLHFGRTAAGFGYVHVRRCKSSVVDQMDEALAKVGEVPGMILDFRGNSGGGFDHEALFGRFIPANKEWRTVKTYHSAGAHPYGGPIVVIVDATVRSAGETGSGMFKEDDRAYMIGESPTAGMSSSKTTIELPSKLFALYVSIDSNMNRFQGGKGIEGLGVAPHELVEFDPADLGAKRDTLILRAEALLADFPQDRVRYDPERMGWKRPPD